MPHLTEQELERIEYLSPASPSETAALIAYCRELRAMLCATRDALASDALDYPSYYDGLSDAVFEVDLIRAEAEREGR
jgi:hypothetical protein